MSPPRDTPLTRFLATQTTQQLHAIRQEFLSEIDGTKQRLGELEEDLDVVEDVIASKSGGQRPPRPKREGRPRPTLRKTVLEFVGQRSHGWTKQEITEELERKGASPAGKNPSNTIATRLGEMVNRGELEKHGELYRLGNGTAAAKGAAQESLPVEPERDT